MSSSHTDVLVDVTMPLGALGAISVIAPTGPGSAVQRFLQKRGAGAYSMRIWMDPEKLYSYNLVPEDVIRAVKEQSQEVAAGQVGMPPAPKDQQFQYTIDILSRFNDPGQFAEIVVKDQTTQGGRLIKIKDVARIDLGAQT